MLCARYILDGNTNNTGSITTKDSWVTPATFGVGCTYQYAMTDGEMKWDAATTAKILNNNAFTWAGWVYVDPNVSFQTAPIFGNGDFGADNNRKFFINQGPTRNDVSWSWMNDAGAITFISGSLTGVLKDFEWTHVAITYGNKTFRIYINGINEYSQENVESKSSSFNYITQVFHSNPARRLQDVRIYNEAISSEEIKQLAYGLQVHDKLNVPITDGKLLKSVSTDTWGVSSGNWNYHQFVRDDGLKYTPNEKIHVTANVSNITGNITQVTVLFYNLSKSTSHGQVNVPIINNKIDVICSPNSECPDLLIYCGISGQTSGKGMTLTNLKITSNLLLSADSKFTVTTGDYYVHTGHYSNDLELGQSYTYKVKCSSPNNVLKSGHGGADGNNNYRTWTAWLYMQNKPYDSSNYGGYDTPVNFNSSNYQHAYDGEYHYWTFVATYKYVAVRMNGYKGSQDYELDFPEITLFKTGTDEVLTSIGDTPRYNQSMSLKSPLLIGNYPINKSNSLSMSFWLRFNSLGNIDNLLSCAMAKAYTGVREINYTTDGSFDSERSYNESSSDGITYKVGQEIVNNGLSERIYTPYSRQGIVLNYIDNKLKATIDDSQLVEVCNVSDNNWHHIVLNSDGFRNLDIYFDNEKKVSGLKPISNYNILRASSSEYIKMFGNISISDFRLYGRHLTEEECLRLYGIAPEDYDITN